MTNAAGPSLSRLIALGALIAVGGCAASLDDTRHPDTLIEPVAEASAGPVVANPHAPVLGRGDFTDPDSGASAVPPPRSRSASVAPRGVRAMAMPTGNPALRQFIGLWTLGATTGNQKACRVILFPTSAGGGRFKAETVAGCATLIRDVQSWQVEGKTLTLRGRSDQDVLSLKQDNPDSYEGVDRDGKAVSLTR